MEQNKITTNQIWFGIFLVCLLIAGYIFAGKFIFRNEEKNQQDVIKEVIKEIIIRRPVCPDTSTSFEELKNSGQIVMLAKGLNSYGQAGELINNKYNIIK